MALKDALVAVGAVAVGFDRKRLTCKAVLCAPGKDTCTLEAEQSWSGKRELEEELGPEYADLPLVEVADALLARM